MGNKLLDLVKSCNNQEDEKTIIEKISTKDIAIIGISCRLPLADGMDEFWENVRNKVDCLMDLPKNRKRDVEEAFKFTNLDSIGTEYCKAAYIHDIDKFDNRFFNLSPKEATLMDPNQRIFLEEAWKVIEDAGYGGDKLEGTRTGVFLGYKFDEYYDYKKCILDIEPSSVISSFNGNLTSITPSRISYLLDLRGPSMLVETACSSSLVALHLACQSIRNKESEMAIVGGLKITLTPIETKEKLGIESSDGRARTFDDDSDGTSMGEGAVTILIKPLHNAIRDRDNIYAVIKGTSINQDGRSIGLTAPNVLAQEDLIVRAWEDAGIHPETITYIETHGTATKMGDPIEVDAIQRAFRRYTNKKQFCAVSSVKSNIGHLDNAAGMVGLLQAVMALKNKEIPPVYHFNKPNKRIDFVESPVYVNDRMQKWETEQTPRRCGISSFGFSGTNCHVVLEEAPEQQYKDDYTSALKIFTLSAKSQKSLKELIIKIKKFVNSKEDINIDDLCYTMNTGRGHYSHRLIIISDDKNDFQDKLNALDVEDLYKYNNGDVHYGIHECVGVIKDVRKDTDITVTQANDMGKKASLIINECITQGNLNKDMLKEICNLYISGAKINWEELYVNQLRRKISLPVYCFERNRCWLEVSEEKITNTFFRPLWVQEELTEISQKINYNNWLVLVFIDEKNIGEDLIQKLILQGAEVVEIKFGEKYEKISQHEYVISGSKADYENLISSFAEKQISKIIHLSSITKDTISDNSGNFESVENRINKGTKSIYYLIKALMNSDKANNKLNLVLISEKVNNVTDNSKEEIIPENAIMFGLGKSIIWECPQIKMKCLDIDERTSIDNIILELAQENNNSNQYQVSYRNNKRYVELINEVDVAEFNGKRISIKSDGVYVITGGTGGIATEICKCLAANKKVHLAIISRTILPEREKWNDILKDRTKIKLANKIRSIIEIEDMGADVDCYSGDICNKDEMETVFCELRKKHGNINGVIHCAGVTDGNIIKDEDEKILESVLHAKVKGTWVLDSITKHDKLDVFIMFSSAITLIGKVGGASYTAANSYLDAFANYRNNLGKNAITINWPSWKDTGMIEGIKINEEKELFKVITPKEAVCAFKKVFYASGRLIVGEINTKSSIFELEEYLPFKLNSNIAINKESSKQQQLEESSIKQQFDIILTGRDDEIYSDTEQIIATIWQDVLGFKELDVNSNFFEIGGDSIMITKMHKMITQLYPDTMTVADLFAYTTISKIAKYIDETSKKEDNTKFEDDISKLIDELETGNVSIDEVVENYDSIKR